MNQLTDQLVDANCAKTPVGIFRNWCLLLQTMASLSELRSDSAADDIMEIISGGTKFKLVVQAIELGIFDELDKVGCPISSAGYAKRCGYDPDVTERFFNVLTAVKLLQKERSDKGTEVYSNRPGTSRLLTRSRRPSMTGLPLMTNMMLPMLDKFPQLIKTGQPTTDINMNINTLHKGSNDSTTQNMLDPNANKPDPCSKAILPHMLDPNANKPAPCRKTVLTVHPSPKDNVTETGNRNLGGPTNMGVKTAAAPDAQMKYIMATEAFAVACAKPAVKAFDLSAHRSAVDLGGGSGRISIALAEEYPEMTVTMFDLPPVVQMAQNTLKQNNNDHVWFKSGDFFQDELPSADLYVLSHILHGWNAKRVDFILSKVFNKLPPGGTLLIFEKLLAEDHAGPELAVINNLMLTLLSQGREMAPSEYRTLLVSHGFTNVLFKEIHGYNYYDVIFAKKPFKTHSR